MRVLLDNCVDHRFAGLITGHEVIHARKQGWADLKNGALLTAAEAAGFAAMITTDKQMRFQQSMDGRKISVLVLGSSRMTLKHIAPLAAQVIASLANLPEGSFLVIVPEL